MQSSISTRARRSDRDLRALRAALDSRAPVLELWARLAEHSRRQWRIDLTDALALLPGDSGRCWHHCPSPLKEKPRHWNRHLADVGDEFAPFLVEGGLSPQFAAPEPWPSDTRLMEEMPEGGRRLLVPFGRQQPEGFLVFWLPADVSSSEPSESFLEFLQALREALPTAIDHLWEAQRLDDHLQAYEGLNFVSTSLQSCRDQGTVAHIVTEALRREFAFESVVLAIVKGPIRLLRGHSVSPEGAANLEAIDFPLGTSDHPLAQLANEGRPVHENFVEPTDPRLSALGITLPAWQVVWLPLIAKGQPVGLLVAHNFSDRGELNEGQRRALELLACHTALALATVRSGSEQEDEAIIDSLTGLHNRRQFDRVLKQEIRRTKRYGAALALLMIDLNDFKSYNDTHGHLAGDQILRDAASIIRENVREADLVARYGGDEFIVLMANTTDAEAIAAAKRIRLAVAAHRRQYADQPARLFDMTIGHHVATAQNVESALEAADRSMYNRKDDANRRRLLDQLIAPHTPPSGRHARLIFGLMKTLSRKNPGHLGHTRRVMGYALKICERLGLGAHQCEQIAMGAILHDIGKVIISTEILNRRGPLTRAEQMLIRSHPLVAADLLSELTFLEPTLSMIRHHHERWDGRTTGMRPGYPDGLKGETIPLGARIIRIADTFDALTSDRPERHAMDLKEAVEVLRQEAGRSLDPNIVAKCLPLFEALKEPIDPDSVQCPLTGE